MAHKENYRLLEILNNCAAECNHCAAACLEEKDVKMLSTCIKLNIDCASICQLTAAYIARGSDRANNLLKECAEICEACAIECNNHGMRHCEECAEVCRQCADECMHLVA